MVTVILWSFLCFGACSLRGVFTGCGGELKKVIEVVPALAGHGVSERGKERGVRPKVVSG